MKLIKERMLSGKLAWRGDEDPREIQFSGRWKRNMARSPFNFHCYVKLKGNQSWTGIFTCKLVSFPKSFQIMSTRWRYKSESSCSGGLFSFPIFVLRLVISLVCVLHLFPQWLKQDSWRCYFACRPFSVLLCLEGLWTITIWFSKINYC